MQNGKFTGSPTTNGISSSFLHKLHTTEWWPNFKDTGSFSFSVFFQSIPSKDTSTMATVNVDVSKPS